MQQATQPDIWQWWQIFANQNFKSLIAQADANNGDLKIAGLRVLEARAQLGIALAGRYPRMDSIPAQVVTSSFVRASASAGSSTSGDVSVARSSRPTQVHCFASQPVDTACRRTFEYRRSSGDVQRAGHNESDRYCHALKARDGGIAHLRRPFHFPDVARSSSTKRRIASVSASRG
jgi:outer membrane protein TolC